jgi:hypothetical protein
VRRTRRRCSAPSRFFGLLLGALAVSLASARVASAKGRRALLWGVLGFVFGPIPLLVVVFLPRKDDRSRRYATSPATRNYVYATPPAPPARGQRPPRRRPRLPSIRRGPGFASERISESATQTLQRWAHGRRAATARLTAVPRPVDRLNAHGAPLGAPVQIVRLRGRAPALPRARRRARAPRDESASVPR